MTDEGKLFDVLPLYCVNRDSRKRTKVNQGGTSSGKTYSIMQVLFVRAMEQYNRVITVVGQDIPNLKKGAFRDAKNIRNSSPILQIWFPKVLLNLGRIQQKELIHGSADLGVSNS